jgi:hypothetical protein
MKVNIKIIALIAAVVVALALPGIGLAKGTGKGHVAIGTISSIDTNQVVINEKVNGKEQPMTFKLDSSTKKMGNLTTGSKVTVHFRNQNSQNVATSVRERGTKAAHTNTVKKSKAS